MGRNWKRAQPHGPAPRQFLTRQLFFRLMKQMLRITHFIGRSENAVRIQIAVALIAFVLLHLLHKMTKAQQGFLELVRLVRANLMHFRSIHHLDRPQPPRRPANPNQMGFELC